MGDFDSPTSEVIVEPAESNNQYELMSNLESNDGRLKHSDASNASKSDDNEDVISESDVSNGSNSDAKEDDKSDSDNMIRTVVRIFQSLKSVMTMISLV
ncbi:hypothetical protein DPMN_082795 [Dreissena polymorpha]|uniref:Uncharacterized protein n=1 Tax=Dreissena polymorpha TaxID=45954 RepID=A0A9D3Y7J2_DREPO|nr:hypothetical protein DPMN_082795 [Dreissena polymorpha]